MVFVHYLDRSGTVPALADVLPNDPYSDVTVVRDMVLQRSVALPSYENQPTYLNLELPELTLGDLGPTIPEVVPARLLDIADYSPDWDFTEGGAKVGDLSLHPANPPRFSSPVQS